VIKKNKVKSEQHAIKYYNKYILNHLILMNLNKKSGKNQIHLQIEPRCINPIHKKKARHA
jgi:CDP-diacylglycerol pyrophosphatase